jgi:hypothetical protein
MSSPISEVVNIVAESSAPSPAAPSQTIQSMVRDRTFGVRSELTNHEVLEGFLNTTLNKKGTYSVFDFEDPTKTIFVELKTRRIRHDQYPTALIGLNKVAFCEFEREVQYWFVFCYTDGLYAIKYDRELFANFETNDNFRRGDRPDVGETSVVYIPVEYLQKIDPNTFAMERPARGGAGAASEA